MKEIRVAPKDIGWILALPAAGNFYVFLFIYLFVCSVISPYFVGKAIKKSRETSVAFFRGF